MHFRFHKPAHTQTDSQIIVFAARKSIHLQHCVVATMHCVEIKQTQWQFRHTTHTHRRRRPVVSKISNTLYKTHLMCKARTRSGDRDARCTKHSLTNNQQASGVWRLNSRKRWRFPRARTQHTHTHTHSRTARTEPNWWV